jgi:predicted ribosomally synthesized peptide with SipW-like signal peptide
MFNLSTVLRNRRTRNKAMAIASAGLVVGVGAAMTLATWTDTEWDFAGAGGVPGLGTSTFVVQQNVTSPFLPAGFNQNHTNPGNSLAFSTGALSLSPGDSVAAPVEYQTTSASIGGTLTLNAAVQAAGVTANDPTNALWNALQVQVGVFNQTPAQRGITPTCNTALTGFTAIPMTGTGLGAVPLNAPLPLQAATGNTLLYCFVVTLPSGSPSTLQGLTVAPAWQFNAVSN